MRHPSNDTHFLSVHIKRLRYGRNDISPGVISASRRFLEHKKAQIIRGHLVCVRYRGVAAQRSISRVDALLISTSRLILTFIQAGIRAAYSVPRMFTCLPLQMQLFCLRRVSARGWQRMDN